MDMNAVIAALRDRAKKFVSLETPKDADAIDTATDIAAGFTPGLGTALAARDFERARRDDDLLGMGLSAAGMVPVVGGVAQAANKARKAEAVVDALRKPSTYDALTGTRDEVRQLIRSDADSLANTLRQRGFDVEVQHSGSLAGPSSYLRIYDPTTGRMFKNEVRLSNHSKGAFQSQFITDVKSKDDFERVLEQADQMRAMGKSAGLASVEAREAEHAAKTRTYWEQVAARANSKAEAGQPLSNRERQALDWVSRNSTR